MQSQPEGPWSTGRFLAYVTPSILSVITVSLYMVVDGFFISRYAGTLALAGVNIIMPLFSLCFGVGIMMAAGASALVGIEIGEGKKKLASRHFTLGILFLLFMALVLVALIFGAGSERICKALGASELLMPLSQAYLTAFTAGLVGIMFQIYFEFFIRLDGKPIWALVVTLSGGITNVILDYFLIVKMDMGITGAGVASASGILVASAVGGFYFFKVSKILSFRKPVFDGCFLKGAIVNGSSEMVTELASGVKTLIFNRVLLFWAGEAGVAAMTILIYLYFLLSSFYIGLSMGVSPLLSISYGAKDIPRLKELLGHSLRVILVASVATFALTLGFGDAIITLFTDGRPDVTTIAQNGLTLFAGAFLVTGLNILSSAGFTALNNGKVSALIAFLRTFVFTIGFVLVLPSAFGLKGVWFSVTAAEILTLATCWVLVMRYREHYLGRPQAVTLG